MSWLNKCYSRLLIDNHITDISPEYMSKFSPEEYVRMVETAKVDSAMVYACCHNGNCYYPTQVGHMHKNLKTRDIFGEVIQLLNKKCIVPIAYYTVVFHNDSALSNPKWQMKDINGKNGTGRYRYSCINNPDYVEFAKQQIAEILEYNIAGIFIDMTFWPMVCFCECCRGKYKREGGNDIPEVISWNNPEWVKFQRFREKTMADFAQILTDHVKSIKPEITVTHQFSPVLHGWFLGQSSGIANASDYTSGDFYGGKYQQRLAAKVFAAYSKKIPYEFMTSRCVNLNDHTSTKSEDELSLHAATTLANGGAYFFIDAINPDGTLNENVYQLFGKIVKRLEPFTECLKKHTPIITADCGVYFSMASCTNASLEGADLRNIGDDSNNMSLRYNAVIEEVNGTAIILNKMKIPWRIVTDSTEDFSGLKTLIVNNAAYMSNEEVNRIRGFVKNGGTLIVTEMSSFYDIDGNNKGDFELAEVLGVSYSGKKSDLISYLDFGKDELISATEPAPLVKTEVAEVRAKVVFPHYPCNDIEKYASIHSNPPEDKTDFAGLTVNRFGKGKCIYLYSSALKQQQYSQENLGRRIFREFIDSPVENSEDLPGCVEITLLKSTRPNTMIIGIVNYQDELPNIPIHDLKLDINLPDAPGIKSMNQVSEEGSLNWKFKNGKVSFTLPYLKDIELIEIEFEGGQ